MDQLFLILVQHIIVKSVLSNDLHFTALYGA